jgi:hypothetical protein
MKGSTMKTTIAFVTGLCLAGFLTQAQTKLDNIIPVKAGQAIRLTFDYPEMVRISTWEKNEIAVQGTVSINNGENDDAFVLDIDNSGSTLDIKGRIKDMDNLPQRITVVRDGQKTTFANEQEWRKFKKENGGERFQMMNKGVDMDIILEIKVPAGMNTSLVSVYGMVEVTNFNGPLNVKATYGGVDAALTESTTGELSAETNYGHIYTNLSLTLDRDRISEGDFHMEVTARPGKGPAYRFESPYGNVYLRKADQN